MSKKVVYKIMIVLISLFVTVNFTFSAEKPIKIKFAHVAAPKIFDSMIHASAVAFKYVLEKRSGGKYEVEIYPSGSLGKEVDTMQAVKQNVIQINLAPMVALFRMHPPIGIFFSPYLFKNEEIAMEVVNGPFGRRILDQVTEKTGIKALAYLGGYTNMAITNNKRVIKTPEDMQGLKFRVMDPLGIAMFKSFGASAVPISFQELFTSLQTGVVDGQTNPPFIVSWAKFNECQKFLTMAKSQWGYQVLLVNQQWYDGLSPADKALVNDSIMVGIETARGLSVLLEDQSLEELSKKGMDVYTVPDCDLEAFAKLARPEGLAWLKEKMGAELVEDLLEAISAAEKKQGNP